MEWEDKKSFFTSVYIKVFELITSHLDSATIGTKLETRLEITHESCGEEGGNFWNYSRLFSGFVL